VNGARDAEVGDHRVCRRATRRSAAEQNVLGLDVAMDDTAAVRISVMSRPSITANGSPVSSRKSKIIA